MTGNAWSYKFFKKSTVQVRQEDTEVENKEKTVG